MNYGDREKIAEFYDANYDKFGYCVKSVGWGSEESQVLRFKVLTEIGDLSNSSICDLGCGFGDLYGHLLKHFPNIEYVGIDLSEKLIAEARRRYPNVLFEVRDILKEPPSRRFTYVLSSGALSLKLEGHEEYIREMLEAMMNLSIKGVAVNFLSSYVDYQLDKNFHFSPERAFTLARTFTKYATLRHDYPLYEFTLYMYRDFV